MILVTGATGTVGGYVAQYLDARGVEYRAMTRHPARVPHGVHGDFDDSASLARAVRGADALFLLTRGGPDDIAMLSTAAKAGVGTIVKLSVIDIGPAADWHRPGEDALRASGQAWTVLRPTTFASNTLHWAGRIRDGLPVVNPTGSARQGIIDPRDIAEVAVEALLNGEHHGRTYTLTGPELLSVADQAAVLAEVLARPVPTVDVSLDELRADLLASGATDEYADGVVAGTRLVLAGRNEVLTPDVAQVLGRAPRTFATWARDQRTAFLAT